MHQAPGERSFYREVLLNPNLEEADLSHKFTIGQTVHLAPSNTRSAVAGDYEVRHLMPPLDYQSEPRYRVRNLAERHERVVALGIPSFLRDSILPQRVGEKALLTKRFAAGDDEGGCATA